MKVRFIKDQMKIKVGEERDLPDHIAKALVDSGVAVGVIRFQDSRSKQRPEKAVIR